MMDYKYFIRKIDHPTDDSIILELSDQRDRPIFDYRPGQYVMITYRNEQGVIMDKHAFSLASSPTAWDHIRLGIKIHGNFTQGLAKLRAGDEVFVSGPFGDFTFNEKKHHDLVMIAGGIGITPFLSAIRYAADKQLPNRMSLLYSSRTHAGTLFYKEIKALEKQNRNFRSLFCLTAPTRRINRQGVVYQKIDARLLGDYLGPLDRKTFFICGPLSFMSGMKENLLTLGVDRSQIEMEEFSMIPATGFWAGVRNISYAISLSGLLLIAPLGLIYSSSAKVSDKKPAVHSILSADYYNTEKFYRLARTTYDQLLAKKRDSVLTADPVRAEDNDLPVEIGGLPVAAEIASTSTSSVPEIINPATEPVSAIARVVKKSAPALKQSVTADSNKKASPKTPAPAKTASVASPKTPATANIAVAAPTPTTAASGAAAEAVQAASNPGVKPVNLAAAAPSQTAQAPSPTTSASAPATAATAQATTPTSPTSAASSQTAPAPAPTTSASAPAPTTTAPVPTVSTPTASTPGQTATAPAPTTSASAPAPTGSTPTVSTPTTSQPTSSSQTTTSRDRHNDDRDEDDD